MLRSWPFRVFAIFFAVVTASLFVYREERDEICSSCLSTRTVVSWAIGVPCEGRGWRVLREDVESLSVAGRELFDPRHPHRWCAPNGCRHSLFWGMGWHAHPSYNRFISDYEENERFRTFVNEKIHAGALSREQAWRLAEFEEPDGMWGEFPMFSVGKQVPLPPTLGARDRELLLLGRALFDEFGGGQAPQDWWWSH